MITEAGGLVGNFTGEADFMDQRRTRRRQPEDLRPAGRAARAVHQRRPGGPAARRGGGLPDVVAAPSADTPEAALERTFGSAEPLRRRTSSSNRRRVAAKRTPVRIRKSDLPPAPPPERGAEPARRGDRGNRDAPAAKRRGTR